MSTPFSEEPGSQSDRSESEAATWLTRLNSRTVDTTELEAFFAWRRSPGNAEAYDRLEAQWRESRRLADDPDIQSAIRGALEPGPTQSRRLIPMALAAGIVSLLATMAFFYLSRDTVFETDIGEQRLVQLDDGSRIHLDTGTRIRMENGNRRTLKLDRGRAFFDVAQDPSHPFTVTADGTEILALGTRFEVETTASGVSVALLEGHVRVQRAIARAENPALDLYPGQSVTMGPAGPGDVRPANPASVIAWTEGRLEFNETLLHEAIVQVNRYSRAKLRISTSRWANERVTGSFSVGDTAAFVDAVTALYPLVPLQRPDGTLELRER
jgi:transmembrane sensor